MLKIIVKKRNKKKEYIPCIIYNKNINFLCSINILEVKKIIKKKAYIVKIKIKNKNTIICLIKDIQYNILRNKILHIDFYKIEKNIFFKTYINIKVKGISIGVAKGAICYIVLKKILIKTKLKNYINKLNINITKLDIGDKIFIKDLIKVHKQIIFLHNPNKIVISIKIKKINKEETKKK